MNGRDFIEFAGAPVANPHLSKPAARYRTAISRSYYGAFHCAVELLAEFGVMINRNHTAHQEVYARLFQTNLAEAQEAANLLNDLRGERNRADYRFDLPAPENAATAKSCVESAHDILACAEECLKEPLRSQLAAILANEEG